MSHKKALRIAEKWARGEGRKSNAGMMGAAYLRLDMFLTDLIAYLDTLSLPEDSACACPDCAAGQKLREIKEALKT